jgi:hypothetical protein
MGGKGSKQRRASQDECSNSGSGMDSQGREDAPPEMLAFLETTSGAKWLSGVVLGEHLKSQVCRVSNLQ